MKKQSSQKILEESERFRNKSGKDDLDAVKLFVEGGGQTNTNQGRNTLPSVNFTASLVGTVGMVGRYRGIWKQTDTFRPTCITSLKT